MQSPMAMAFLLVEKVLVGKISMEDTFRVTKIVQELDPAYTYCHVLAHKLSFAESQRKQDDWKEITKT